MDTTCKYEHFELIPDAPTQDCKLFMASIKKLDETSAIWIANNITLPAKPDLLTLFKWDETPQGSHHWECLRKNFREKLSEEQAMSAKELKKIFDEILERPVLTAYQSVIANKLGKYDTKAKTLFEARARNYNDTTDLFACFSFVDTPEGLEYWAKLANALAIDERNLRPMDEDLHLAYNINDHKGV
jgi:hypothetical protein